MGKEAFASLFTHKTLYLGNDSEGVSACVDHDYFYLLSCSYTDLFLINTLCGLNIELTDYALKEYSPFSSKWLFSKKSLFTNKRLSHKSMQKFIVFFFIV